MVKFLLLAVLSFSAFAKVHYMLPENDLWKEDRLTRDVGGQEVFNKVIDLAYSIYKPFADNNNETLVINKKWDDPTVNASTMRFWGTVTINMYGGLARRPEITPEGFAFVLCHELGHAYGGRPYLSTSRKLSAEGQSDYYAAKDCVRKVIEKLEITKEREVPTPYMTQSCDQTFSNETDYKHCLKGLLAGQALGNLLAVIKKEKIPNYDTPDSNIVDQTMLSYPDTVQCRLDTMYNGILNKDRPLCWYKD